jgi:glycerol-3-phosphate dehydrogenase (NAD(P)+)
MTRADTVGIVGMGPFGTGLASVLARAGRRVIVWSRDTAVVDAIQTRRACPRLPSAPLPEPLEATADPKRLAAAARFLVMAVTSTNVRERAREVGDVIDGSHILVHAIGALASPTNERVSEVLAQAIPTLKIGVLAGPALPVDLAEHAYSSMSSARVAASSTRHPRFACTRARTSPVWSSHPRSPVPTRSRSGCPTGSAWAPVLVPS